MTKRERELDHLFSTTAEQYGAQFVGLRPTGRGHYEAAFNKGGALVRIFLSATPGDVRTIHNDAAQARRLLRRIA